MRALCLSGGGSKGAYQVGALRRLVELEEQYDLFSGVSVGALNATLLVQNPTLAPGVSVLSDIWASLTTRDVARKRFLGPLSLLWAPSIYTAEPLKALVNRNLDYDKLQNSGKKLQIVSVNMCTGATAICTEKAERNLLVDHILASAVAPILYPPVIINEEAHTDGGIRHVSPLDAAIHAGASHIDLILCSGKAQYRWDAKVTSILSYADRVIDIMLAEIANNDIVMTQLHNKLRRADSQHAKKEVSLRICRPAKMFEVASSEFDPAVSQRLMKAGYEDALMAFG
jgi:predicted acylesterase/phospholipase RssA